MNGKETSQIEKIAERLLVVDSGYIPGPYSRRPQLSDLWPKDRDRYIKLAEEALRHED